MASSQEEVRIKEEIYSENNIIISDSTIRNIIYTKQIKCLRGKRLCVIVSFVYLKNYAFVFFCLCLRDSTYVPPTNIYTRQDLAMMETSISDFHKNLYIPVI